MRKFKLIKEYPNSPKIGTILNSDTIYTKDKIVLDWKGTSIDPKEYPEFWQEIKEYPKIISFKGDGSNIATLDEYGTYTYNSNNVSVTKERLLSLIGKGVTIHQVQTSDTKVFTVGDKVNYYGENCKIIRFYFNEHKQLSFEVNAKKASTPKTGVFGSDEKYNYLKKAPTPLFTTEDNFEIVDVLTRVYVVWNNKLTISNERFWDVQIPAEMKECKVFYNKESAEKFVDKNKPRFSVKDVEDALTMNWGRTTGDTIGNVLVLDEGKFRQKLGI